MNQYPKKDQNHDNFHTGSSWAESRPMNVTDVQIRAAGFRLKHRKSGEEPIWEDRHHKEFRQSEILRLLDGK